MFILFNHWFDYKAACNCLSCHIISKCHRLTGTILQSVKGGGDRGRKRQFKKIIPSSFEQRDRCGDGAEGRSVRLLVSVGWRTPSTPCFVTLLHLRLQIQYVERDGNVDKSTLATCTFTLLRLVFPMWVWFVPLRRTNSLPLRGSGEAPARDGKHS